MVSSTFGRPYIPPVLGSHPSPLLAIYTLSSLTVLAESMLKVESIGELQWKVGLSECQSCFEYVAKF